MSTVQPDDEQVRGLRPEDAVLAQWAVEEAQRLGASYADARWGLLETRRLRVKDGRVNLVAHTYHRGLGLRVLCEGAWGFVSHPLLPAAGQRYAAPPDKLPPAQEEETAAAELESSISAIDDVFEAPPDRDEISDAAAAPAPSQLKETIQGLATQAVVIAATAAKHRRRPVVLAPADPESGVWRTPRTRDPFDVPLEEIVDHLMTVESAARHSEKDLNSVDLWFTAWRRAHWLCTSEGSQILQEVLECGGGFRCMAHRDGITQERGSPGLRGGHRESGGYERFLAQDLAAAAPRMASEAVALTTAPPCPSTEADLIIDGSLAAIQIHETIGHAVELDRVMGSEESLAGGSHLTPDKLGWFRFGSELVHAVADATIPLGLGSFGFDDEGVPGHPVPLIRGGVFVGYLTDRETAHLLGLASSGAARAQDWSHQPLIRMTNINLRPGGWSLDELFADTERGFYFETAKNPSIDHLRLNFHVPAEVGWEIRNGRKIRMFRDPSYGGIAHRLWRSCDAIADRNHWRVWGIPTCGKGDPGQSGHVGHGAAPLRMRGVSIGSRRAS
ncbi:MAG: TldD/PmbA family protein [Candidatus Eisenbacteria bacterium]|nr:TldD/PmbA family protein [Candidatus Eisenbacteria bacterium]